VISGSDRRYLTAVAAAAQASTDGQTATLDAVITELGGDVNEARDDTSRALQSLVSQGYLQALPTDTDQPKAFCLTEDGQQLLVDLIDEWQR